MTKRLRFCLLLFAIWHSPVCEAAGQDNAADISGRVRTRVDELIGREIKDLKGYAVAVIKDGTVILKQGYGFANVEAKIAVTPQTVFGLASLTKAFTAICILALAEHGKLSLEDDLNKYIDGLPAPYQRLTIRQLATMTSGVPATVEPEVEWDGQLPMLVAQPLDFKPGSSFRYSNFSYRLLGSVIEKAAGKPYRAAVEDIIFKPNGMLNTGTVTTRYPTGIVVAQGYDKRGRIPYRKPEISFASGMFASNLDDMIKYIQALLARKILLRPESYTAMWYERPLVAGKALAWAFGWSAATGDFFGGTRTVEWYGTNVGVTATLMIFPDKNSAIISLCNSQDPSARRLTQKIAHVIFGGNG